MVYRARPRCQVSANRTIDTLVILYQPRHDKICVRGYRSGPAQTGLPARMAQSVAYLGLRLGVRRFDTQRNAQTDKRRHAACKIKFYILFSFRISDISNRPDITQLFTVDNKQEIKPNNTSVLSCNWLL